MFSDPTKTVEHFIGKIDRGAMTHRKRLNRIKKALASIGYRVTTKHSFRREPHDLFWLATDGDKGNYSALNINVKPEDAPFAGATMEHYKRVCRARAIATAEALHRHGITTFSAYEAFKDINGNWHGGSNLGQVCIVHDAGFEPEGAQQ